MQKYLIILVFMFCAPAFYASEISEDFSKGPLFGKNMYIPFLIHYNFPSMPAKSGNQNDFQYHLSYYATQDARYRVDMFMEYTGRVYDKNFIVIDYEGHIAELGFSYNFLDNIQAGADMRVFSYSGGFLDNFIESFHGLFGFSNGAREYFLQNQIYIDIPNSNGIPLNLEESVVSFGDIDLWCKWTFFEKRKMSLAALGAFKIPAGKLEKLSGSGYPDLAAGLLMDYRISRLFTLYSQAGIVVPLNFKSYPMFNGLLGTEFHPWKFLSFNLQMNIKTSPLSDKTVPFGWNDIWGTNFYQFSLPQLNVLGGIVMNFNDIRLQFYIEEDAIFNQGNDLIMESWFRIPSI